MRTLLLIAAIVLLFMVVRTLLRRPGRSKPAEPGVLPSRNMVRCDYCGLHVPEGEAVQEGERRYCSETHRQQDRVRDTGAGE